MSQEVHVPWTYPRDLHETWDMGLFLKVQNNDLSRGPVTFSLPNRNINKKYPNLDTPQQSMKDCKSGQILVEK
jgi:hypothetical protein